MVQMLTFDVENIEKKLKEIKEEQRDIGVGTETLNRFPIFEATLRAEARTRTFENKNKHCKITVSGRLGQNHKSLLEAILYKRKFYKAYKDEEGKPHIKILYSEYEVKKHLSKSVYSKERYKALLDDMKEAYVKIEKEDRIIEGKLIEDVTISHKYSKRTKSNLPGLKNQEIPYCVLTLGDVTTQLILEEFKFTYDPKPITTELTSGISQAIVRYINTHSRHPNAGYHLKELVQNLKENVEGQEWYNVKTFLKKDADKLKRFFGIVIDFKKDRLFVFEKSFL